MRIALPFAVACAAFAMRAAPPAFEKEAVPFPDLGLSFSPLAEGAGEPINLPSAHAYLVSDADALRMEDRYDVADLWYGATIRARWADAAGNRLTLVRLDTRFPDDPEGTLKTRTAYDGDAVPLLPREREYVRDAMLMAAPFEIGEWVRPQRMRRTFFDDVRELTATNACWLAYAFRPACDRKGGAPWYGAFLEVASPDDAAAAAGAFGDWLDGVRALPVESPRPHAARNAARKTQTPTEYERLVRDFTANVANYANWKVTSAADCLIADELGAAPGRADLVAALTNDLPRFRTAFAERLPTPLAESVPPAAIRLFAERDSYLAYVGQDLDWSAAIWSVERRELVLYLPETGTDELLATVWHEGFHQYLDYASATVQSAPWFNEGHAQLFQHAKIVPQRARARGTPAETRDWRITFGYDEADMAFIRANAERLAALLPTLLLMDYAAFYAKDVADERVADAMRRCNYRLAWSIAYFLEVGAPEVRFRPFAGVRSGYLKTLMKTRRMQDATRSAFAGELMKTFADEWLSFYRER